MSLPELSVSDARRVLMARQGLMESPREKVDHKSLEELIRRLGFVQLDSISMVDRAHHMILHSRNETYKPQLLEDLHEKDRVLFEGWTHDASLIPTEFFPFWRVRFDRSLEAMRKRYKKRRGFDPEDHAEELIKRIQKEGPVMARDFKREDTGKTRGWWDWHPAKTTLEYLWRAGVLSITRRENFQKVYDLTENVIPARYLKKKPDVESYIDWACNEAFDRIGFGTAKDIRDFWFHLTPQEAKNWCNAALEQGDLIEVELNCPRTKETHKVLTRPETVESLADLPEPPKRMRALSPFDPVIRDRDRLERLFYCDYRIEVFVPAAKRKYGYYVFPLIEGDRIVGRVDMKYDKKMDALNVKGAWPEPGVKWGKARRTAFDAELERKRRFVGAEKTVFEKNWWHEEKPA